MALNSESKYPSRRAYVLKLHREATANTLAGRVENLVTGCHREFASAVELFDFIATDLAASTEERCSYRTNGQ